MKILIVTNSCSKEKYQQIEKMRTRAIVDPQQKFFRLFIEGLGSIETEETIDIVSAIPVSASTVPKKIFAKDIEKKDKILYTYLPFINGKILRYISLFVSCKSQVKLWCKNNVFLKDSIILVDPLVPFLSIPTRLLAKKYGIKIGAIVTDLPTLSTSMKNKKESLIKRIGLSIYQKIANKDIVSYDFYIPLTSTINAKVNENNKPFLIVEGFADIKDRVIFDVHKNYVMYAGGVYEKYGLKNLVQAFIEMNNKNVELFIFGDGSYVEEVKKLELEHPTIKYKGCVSQEKIVEYEKRALLLVNPRPTDEEFSIYSFPSKTMEYLLSGSAVVSTKLAGIPEEYFKYMYAFENGSVSGIKDKLTELLNMPIQNLIDKGKDGHDFVIKEKNNIYMSEKVLNFLKSL